MIEEIKNNPENTNNNLGDIPSQEKNDGALLKQVKKEIKIIIGGFFSEENLNIFLGELEGKRRVDKAREFKNLKNRITASVSNNQDLLKRLTQELENVGIMADIIKEEILNNENVPGDFKEIIGVKNEKAEVVSEDSDPVLEDTPNTNIPVATSAENLSAPVIDSQLPNTPTEEQKKYGTTIEERNSKAVVNIGGKRVIAGKGNVKELEAIKKREEIAEQREIAEEYLTDEFFEGYLKSKKKEEREVKIKELRKKLANLLKEKNIDRKKIEEAEKEVISFLEKNRMKRYAAKMEEVIKKKKEMREIKTGQGEDEKQKRSKFPKSYEFEKEWQKSGQGGAIYTKAEGGNSFSDIEIIGYNPKTGEVKIDIYESKGGKSIERKEMKLNYEEFVELMNSGYELDFDRKHFSDSVEINKIYKNKKGHTLKVLTYQPGRFVKDAKKPGKEFKKVEGRYRISIDGREIQSGTQAHLDELIKKRGYFPIGESKVERTKVKVGAGEVKDDKDLVVGTEVSGREEILIDTGEKQKNENESLNSQGEKEEITTQEKFAEKFYPAPCVLEDKKRKFMFRIANFKNTENGLEVFIESEKTTKKGEKIKDRRWMSVAEFRKMFDREDRDWDFYKNKEEYEARKAGEVSVEKTKGTDGIVDKSATEEASILKTEVKIEQEVELTEKEKKIVVVLTNFIKEYLEELEEYLEGLKQKRGYTELEVNLVRKAERRHFWNSALKEEFSAKFKKYDSFKDIKEDKIDLFIKKAKENYNK